MKRSILWWGLAGFAILVAAGIWWLTQPRPVLTVTTWPGPYGRAQASAYFRPFSEAKGIDVRIAQYDGGLDHLRGEVASHHYDWDVIDFELDDAVTACHAGLLEHIDSSTLPAGSNGAPATADFVKSALGPCWAGTAVFSQVIAYSKTRFQEAQTQPDSLSDFFDLARFPGRRALRGSSPKLNLELALLADGVRPSDIYATLSTPQGVTRALNKLGTIRPAIAWWSSASEPIAMLASGEVAFATALNGDVFDAQRHRQPIGLIWDRQLYELDVFGIVKGDPKRDLAFDFVRYATGSEPLAHAADWVPYGPARESSLSLVGRNPELGIAMLPALPTAKTNFGTAFAIDDEWWRAHGEAIDGTWHSWLAAAP